VASGGNLGDECTQSSFEFSIRVQEFIELVKQNKTLEAIVHARKHLSPLGMVPLLQRWLDVLAATNLIEIQKVMTLLAFKKDTNLDRYKVPAYIELS
jgi:hypothetical protein